jgi:hypothetical protein
VIWALRRGQYAVSLVGHDVASIENDQAPRQIQEGEIQEYAHHYCISNLVIHEAERQCAFAFLNTVILSQPSQGRDATKNPAISSRVFKIRQWINTSHEATLESLGGDCSCLGNEAFKWLGSVLDHGGVEIANLCCLGNVTFKS